MRGRGVKFNTERSDGEGGWIQFKTEESDVGGGG